MSGIRFPDGYVPPKIPWRYRLVWAITHPFRRWLGYDFSWTLFGFRILLRRWLRIRAPVKRFWTHAEYEAALDYGMGDLYKFSQVADAIRRWEKEHA